MHKSAASTALGFLVLISAACLARAETLFPTNSLWRFWPGTNEVTTLIPAWRTNGFNDSAWTASPAPFFYGEPLTPGTLLSGMGGNYTSFFLRKTFVLADVSGVGSLTLRAAVDDGFQAWINGTLVAACNPPPISVYNAVASASAAEPVPFIDYLLPLPASLRNGTNVLAVQVFNSSLASSDIVFDAALFVEPSSTNPLSVLAVTPTPGLVSNLTSVRVTFSEKVTGLRSSDLLLNGVAAAGVSGSGADYTFTFPQPPYGTITVGWDPANAILAIANPPRRLLPSTPGSLWTYELLDLLPPALAFHLPLAGATVRAANEAEVVFNKSVTGVDPGDLLLNGVPATNVYGLGAGPYRFQFPSPTAGAVTFSFAPTHGIQSDAVLPQPFAGATWTATLDPSLARPDLRLNELVAENHSGLRDEDQDLESWIELHNRGTSAVNLQGWSLTDDPQNPGQWVFPSVTVPAGGYLVVFASGKDRAPTAPGARLHTNFKLSTQGEYLGLYGPDAPRAAVDELRPGFPPQATDHSYGRDPAGGWRYFITPTPGATNNSPTASGRAEAVHFSAGSGFFASPFELSLDCPTPGTVIRYTLDCSVPTETTGLVYAGRFTVTPGQVVRAAAFKKNLLPSEIGVRTYLQSAYTRQRYLPALSIVTASNNLFGTSGILEPPNPQYHGIAWERPASLELFNTADGRGFAINCGIRVAGGSYIRPLLDYRKTELPFNKYSFRLYFRGDYGPGRLHYAWFPTTTLDSFDRITLRAGMNDHSNPFIRDEFVRRLESDVGQVASHGTFINLFLNGRYKGYYNPAEYIDASFLSDHHGSTNLWDLIDQETAAREGDTVAWNQFQSFVNSGVDLSVPANYLQVNRMLDLTNFVDYLLPLVYADADDWPHNNWRAARERSPNGRFRFYAWDAEWSFGGLSGGITHDTIAGQLSSTAPPWGTTILQTTFNRLKVVPEFKLLFADRVHKHLFNGGALANERISATYEQLRADVTNTIGGFNNSIGVSWIPGRRSYFLSHLQRAGFLASSNAPTFSPFGGRVPYGLPLALASTNGTLYYTTNGTDPRTAFTGAVSPDAFPYTSPLQLTHSLQLNARTLSGSTWSALSQAEFLVAQPGSPLRISEIMYHPIGGDPTDGDAFEYLEILSLAPYAINLQDYTLQGVTFRFPVGGAPIGPGARLILASNKDPVAFAARYPNVTVAGYFDGTLSNSGERIALLDADGHRVTSVTYEDASPWPAEADGAGASLEITDPRGDTEDPANWHASFQTGGTPGLANSTTADPVVRLSEVQASPATQATDWVELWNSSTSPADLSHWTLRVPAANQVYTFPANTLLAPSAYLVVACDTLAGPGLHTGFALSANGETLALHQPDGTRMDCVTFGSQAPGYAIGRLGSTLAWVLTEPTPGAANEPASLAPASGLVLNELLPNPSPGEDDWVEVFNTHPTLPAALQGLQLEVNGWPATLQGLGFVPAGGFAVLRADGESTPNHLDQHLPAAGAWVRLLDPSGTPVSSLTYKTLRENLSFGCLPDGSTNTTPFPGTASPGASNHLLATTGPVLNEFLARPPALDPAATDWIELFNPQPAPFDLSGMSLRLNLDPVATWTFPAGTTIAAQGYLVLACNPDLPASTNFSETPNTGHGLNGDGGAIQLLDAAGRVADFIDYGAQIPGCSVGRSDTGWSLQSPTPAAANGPALPLGDPTLLRFNEWMAAPATGDDWFELFNPGTLPVDMDGMTLTDDFTAPGITNTIVPPRTYVAPQGFILWTADGNAPAAGHTSFQLDERGEQLRLYLNAGTVVDTLTFSQQQVGASEGRFPDAATTIARFTTTPSPGRSNYLPLRHVAIQEILTHTDPPLEDAIKIGNLSDSPVDLGGWYLAADVAATTRWQIPAPFILPPGGHRVLYEYQFNAHPGASNSFELDSAHGGVVTLAATDATGQPTGYRDALAFDAAANGVSFGRVPTSQGTDVSPLSVRGFGVETPSSLAEFRTGTGVPNSAPRVGPVVISEIMYHPVTGPTNNPVENPDHEYLELHNPGAANLPLFDVAHPTNTWRVRGGIAFAFPPSFTLPAGACCLLVPFNPATQPETLAAFRTYYSLGTASVILGPYTGRLGNGGDNLFLERPDNPQGPGRPDAGFVPYLQVDRVRYAPDGAWPAEADGTGQSLQRRAPLLYGNEPLHWKSALPSPGTVSGPSADEDRDQDGMPNGWEQLHGLNPDDRADAGTDADADGLTAFQEYVLGTDPRDAASGLELELHTTADEYILRFIARSARTYTIEYTDDPGLGDWSKLIDVPAGTGPEQIEVTLTRLGQPAPRYFRVVTPGRF